MNRTGFAGDLKPEKDDSHGKEQDGPPPFTGSPRPRAADDAGHQSSYETQGNAIAAIAPKIGCTPQTLAVWLRKAANDAGAVGASASDERDRIKLLKAFRSEPGSRGIPLRADV